MRDPETFAHQQWLGYVQPVGLVVSIPALLAAQAHINRNIIPDHQRFLDCLPRDAHDEPIDELRDFAEFTRQVLKWRAGDLAEFSVVSSQFLDADRLTVVLPEYGETLRPTHVVFEYSSSLKPRTDNQQLPTPQMLIQVLPPGTPLDEQPPKRRPPPNSRELAANNQELAANNQELATNNQQLALATPPAGMRRRKLALNACCVRPPFPSACFATPRKFGWSMPHEARRAALPRSAFPKWPRSLDGREVPTITAYLFHAGGHDDPDNLHENSAKSFIGSYVLGMGFTFDDTDPSGVANSLAAMNQLIAKDPRNAERIFPYIGGEEINENPTHNHYRYVICFGQLSETDARRWPDLMNVVEQKVKPERMRLGNNSSAQPRKENWWLWGRYTPGLFTAIASLSKVMMLSRVGQHGAIAFMPTNIIPSEGTVTFAFHSHAAFGVLQSRLHDIWARFFASSLEERLRYTPSDCFETFPFPAGVLEAAAASSLTTNNQQLATLDSAGRDCYEFRAALMVRNNEGLTKTYNRFHDPYEKSPEILKLRELHAAMDGAVLEAYGWHDLAATATCDFLLDYEDDADDDEPAPGRRARRKPWRLRWPDDFRDEVLARLLALNAARAEQERLAGQTAAASAKPKRSRKKSAAKPAGETRLFDEGQEST